MYSNQQENYECKAGLSATSVFPPEPSFTPYHLFLSKIAANISNSNDSHIRRSNIIIPYYRGITVKERAEGKNIIPSPMHGCLKAKCY